MAETPERIGVLTSGGDAPGMNAAIRAVVRAAAFHGLQAVGIRYGYTGLLGGDLVPLGPRDVAGIIHRGGTILQTSRCPEFLEARGREQAMEVLRAEKLDALVVIGGDGSFRGAERLALDFGFAVAGIPGTIDNDIGGTEITLGFATAVNTAVEAIDRIRDTAASLDRIFVVEVMGRACGALALASAVAGGAEEIVVPEDPGGRERLVASIRTAADRGKKSMIVVVAEGERTGGAHAIARTIQEAVSGEVRVTILGHIQRGGSPTASDRLLAGRMAVQAVEALLAGERGFMTCVEGGRMSIRPLADAWTLEHPADLELLHLNQVLSV